MRECGTKCEGLIRLRSHDGRQAVTLLGLWGNLKQTAVAWGNVGMIIVDYCELKRCTFIKSYRMADIFKIHEVAIHEVGIHEVGKLKRVFG